MDLTTRYAGLQLPHPFVVGAGPLADDVRTAREAESSGAAAIVMRSLFEEQITQEQMLAFLDAEVPSESYAEATSYFPEPQDYALGPERYLDHLAALKDALQIPVIGSLNGATDGGWLDYAGLIEEAGADALELNLYFLATDPDETSEAIEHRLVEIVRRVADSVRIPVAVKVSAHFTAFASLARRLDRAGAAGLVLFNRFYQPDIVPDEMEVVPALKLSDPGELLLRLRWLAILHGRLDASLAVTGGVHSGIDAIKALMAGADAVQLVSVLLARGIDALGRIRDEAHDWMVDAEYESLAQLRGSMSLQRCPNPAAFERGNYTRVLQSWEGRWLARGDALFRG